MQVYINDKDRSKPRRLVEAEKLKETASTVIVRLPDGNIVSRKKSRDLPKEPEPTVPEKKEVEGKKERKKT